jgi:hypothetical protein
MVNTGGNVLDTSPQASQRHGNIHWHTAFFQAIQLELADYRDVLEFKYEYQLTSEPLRVDTLIIMKPPNVRIDKNIAQIFKTVNICEYKSPDDYLSMKDFFKVYAYACLYAAITPDASLSDITLTFVESRHPRTLLKYFTEERQFRVEERWPGIHLVTGDYLPVQIIESKKLSDTDNLWLKSLGKDLAVQNAGSILKSGKTTGKYIPLDAYFYALLYANPRTFQEVFHMTDQTLTIEDVLTEAGFIPRWLEEGRREGKEKGREEGREAVAQNLLKLGWSIEQTAEVSGLHIEKVKALRASI